MDAFAVFYYYPPDERSYSVQPITLRSRRLMQETHLTILGRIKMDKRYWEWEPVFEIDPAKSALLIIDMQNGFVDRAGERRAAKGGQAHLCRGCHLSTHGGLPRRRTPLA